MKKIKHFNQNFRAAFIITFLVFFIQRSNAQVTIASDGLNNSTTLFTLAGGAYYTGNSAAGDGPGSSPFAVEGTHSRGVINGTATLTTSNINTTGYTSIQMDLRVASFSITGVTTNGADPADYVSVEVSPDGGTNYYNTAEIIGPTASNAYWSYSGGTGIASTPYDGDVTTVQFQPANSGSRTTDGYSTIRITSLPATATLKVRITLLNNANKEQWVVDDFKITGTVAGPMSFTSCTTTQANVASVSPSATSQEIIGIQVVTTGSTSPLTASSFTFTTTGSTSAADITNAKLWTTGTSSAFATTTQLGATTVSPSGTFTITGGANMPYTLSSGTNYFWITYDISGTATIGDVVDAECNSITITSARTPSTQAPAGNRLIAASYCSSTSTSATSYFNAFSTTGGITNITNAASGYSATGYGNFTAQSVSQMQTSSVNFNTTLVGTTVGVNIWVDWNQDGDFVDAGENVYSTGGYVSTSSGSFTVPFTATVGSTRMRIRMDYNNTDPAICGSTTRGETEDYTFIITALPACSGTPTAGTATAGTTSFTCSGSTTITLTGYTNATGISFQWQSSPAGANTWTNIAGATNSTYSTGTVSSSMDYRCVVSCSNSGLTANSTTATVTINANVPGSASASSTLVCSGSTTTISLTGATVSGSTRQWQSSPDNSAWTNIAGATGATYAATPTVATYYRCVITCTASGTSLNSTSVLVTINTPANCYCSSSATSTSDMDITNVNFGTINNTSATVNLTGTQGTATGTAGMYSNWRASTVPVPSLQQGSTTAFSVTIGGTAYSHRVDVYIDLNQDGDFVDAGESFPIFSYANPTLPNTTASSIAIPISATVGNTLMRVVCVESSSTSPCGTYTWGETEDYLINITAAPACSGTPTAGTTNSSINPICSGGTSILSVTGSSIASGLTYQWQASTDNATWVNIPGATSATYSASPSSATWYRRIITCTASGLSSNSVSIQQTIGLSTLCYCTSGATSTSDMDITNVTFGTINNTSATVSLTGSQGTATGTAGEYSDFWGAAGVPVPSIMQGATSTISITIGGTAYSHRVDVYIDLNQDGDLVDAGESFSVWTYANPTLPNTSTASIQIPINAAVGNTLMRVVCVESSTTDPCGTYSWGETEDYKINIIAAPACSGVPTPGTAVADMTSFCNSASPNFDLTGYTIATGIGFQWQSSLDNATWSIETGATNTSYSSPSISQTTYFRCEVRCGASVAYSNVLTLTKTSQSILTTNNPVSIACNGTASLTATASGGASIKWYAAASGGLPLFTGSPYTTPALSANTTYYCVANSGSSTENGGMPVKGNTYGTLSVGYGIIFDATQTFTLNSVTIYPKGNGTVTIAYQNSAGVEQATTAAIAVNGGASGSAVVVPLGWAIPVGTNYRLVLKARTGITDLIYDYNTNFDYISPSGALAVTSGWYGSGTSSTNYFFYNLNISIPCESTPRTPVNVLITSGVTAPVCSATPSPANSASGVCPVSTIVSWDASSTACRAATSYLLYFGTDVAATNIINGVNIGNVLSYNLGTLTGSTQYYWKIVPVNFAGNATGCSMWSFTTAANPGSICQGLLGAGVVSIPSLPYASGAGTTAGAGNNLTSANVVTCGSSSYLTGEDQVFVFTPASSGSITIQLTSTGTYTGLMLYDGCPLSAGACGASPGNCVGSATSYTGDKTLTVCIVAGTTYYLILDSYSSPANNPYTNLTISTPSGTLAPVNDLPCSASALTLGVLANGDNSCAGSTSEPTAPTCWTSGVKNTVWYAVVAPASGQLSVKTITSGLTDTQIGVFSGTCSSLTSVTNGCNNNIAGCGSTSASQVNLSGLTPGATYYVVVDGANDLMGTFSIMAIDPATSTFPVTPGQDCTASFPTCNSVLNTSDPGYANTGSTCDFTSANNCMGSGERSSVWYTIQIQNTGSLNFDIIPNDYSGLAAGAETDYDFIIWKTVGSGATSCAGITANAATGLVGCNYSSIGVTGVAPGGNAPAGFGTGFDGAYESTISVVAGEEYTICISNFTQSTSGFTVDYTTTTGSAINYTPSPLTLNWTGTTSTAWSSTANWGACNIPACAVSAVIGSLVPRMPTISSNATVKDLTINSGATLTIGAGVTLTVCGNFTNNGTLVCSPTSTILFTNPITHTMSGNFTGTNAIGNLTLTASGAGLQVNLLSDLDLKGNFTTSNSNSIFNTNSHYIKLAGNFINATGNTTFASTGTAGTLEFNGTGAQIYNQGSSVLDLNFVVMNNSGSGLTLATDMNIKSVTGTLTLTIGQIITTPSFKVVVNNSTSTSVSTGNTSSYVYGFLRRFINNSTGSYDFPVGTSTAYERANVNFTTAPTITYLTADFQTYATVPAALGSTECSATYDAPALNNGFWNIDANTANNNTGVYNMTLYNSAYTNPASGWTIMAKHNGSASWGLLNGDGSAGTCIASPVTAVVRNNMKGFSKFATAQTNGPLPIELLSFTGESEGSKNRLNWITISETNNDYFSLEHSADGSSFKEFATKDGAGNSTSKIHYVDYDLSPFNGTTYYRLKQIDFNGQYSYSSIISITNKLDEIAVVNVHPNPTSNDISFDFLCPVKGTLKIQIYDYTGRLVIDKSQNVDEGKTSLNTQMENLSKGVYSLKVEFSEGSFSTYTKIIKN